MMQQLLMAMHEMGITPEELMQVAAAGGGAPGGAPGGDPMAAAMGGAPPMGGGAPPMGGPAPADPMMGGQPKMAELHTMAKAARDFQRSGRFELKLASTPQERGLRNRIKTMLSELVRT